ncbi:MAG: histidine--tRNA ligase [Acidobacteria bacterium]|nr:histidine--tRNA ligase [Acidobacteriota bacterium]
MGETKQFRAIKGTRDILPPDSALWNWFESTARRVLETYGFGEIRLPILEQTELFARSIGMDSDIISKEMFTFDRKLEVLRKAIVEGLGDVKHESRVHTFGQHLAVLAYNLGQAIENGVLEKNIANLQRVGEIEKLSRECIQAWNAGDKSPSPNWDNRFQRCKELLSNLSLLIRVGDSESLRPEGTASVVRAYIEHGMHVNPGLTKLYYIGPMFRRERPQKGRYRQFYQIGAEVLGTSDHPAIDAELIEMLMHLFDAISLSGCTLHINSIGCKNCRPAYIGQLKAALLEVKEKLGPDSQRRIETNPLRVLDSKVAEEQAVIETLPRIADSLCPECREHFSALKTDLTQNRGIAFEENWRLVRGLDYYIRTTFEITAPGLGSQNAVCGGGRYDGLAKLLGGQDTKGIGFAIGTDRVILSLQDSGKAPATPKPDLYIAWLGAAAQQQSIRTARKLRNAGCMVEVAPEEMKLKRSMGLADKLGARFALIIGENEIKSGKFMLKRLSDATQSEVAEADLLKKLKQVASH